MPPHRIPNTRDAGLFGEGGISKLYGVYRGLVYASDDPTQSGRVQVNLPFLGSTMWALVASPMQPSRADKKNPSDRIQPGTIVVVAFEGGDPSQPIVLGRLGT